MYILKIQSFQNIKAANACRNIMPTCSNAMCQPKPHPLPAAFYGNSLEVGYCLAVASASSKFLVKAQTRTAAVDTAPRSTRFEQALQL